MKCIGGLSEYIRKELRLLPLKRKIAYQKRKKINPRKTEAREYKQDRNFDQGFLQGIKKLGMMRQIVGSNTVSSDNRREEGNDKKVVLAVEDAEDDDVILVLEESDLSILGMTKPT